MACSFRAIEIIGRPLYAAAAFCSKNQKVVGASNSPAAAGSGSRQHQQHAEASSGDRPGSSGMQALAAAAGRHAPASGGYVGQKFSAFLCMMYFSLPIANIWGSYMGTVGEEFFSFFLKHKDAKERWGTIGDALK